MRVPTASGCPLAVESGETRAGAVDRGHPHPPEHSDADELLEAVVAAGFGRVERAVRIHPRPVDAAGDELARGLALLSPTANLGPVALPDLDTRAGSCTSSLRLMPGV